VDHRGCVRQESRGEGPPARRDDDEVVDGGPSCDVRQY
jgi:hypothetical protein